MLALLLPVVLPVLVQECGKVARRYLKEKRKEAERKQEQEVRALRERIERLEAREKWTR